MEAIKRFFSDNWTLEKSLSQLSDNSILLPLIVIVVGAVMAFGISQWLSNEQDQETQQKKQEIQALLQTLKATKTQIANAKEPSKREALIADGRETLARLESLGHNASKLSTAPSGHRGLTIFVLLVAVLFVVGSVQLVTKESTERMDDAQTTARLSQLQNKKQLQAAQSDLEKDPSNLGALKILARRALLDQNLQDAMNYVMRADALTSDDIDVQIYQGALAALVNMSTRAIERLEPVLEKDPSQPEAHWWLGIALANANRFDEAMTPLKQVIKLAPDSEEARYAKTIVSEIMARQNIAVHASGSVSLPDGVSPPELGVLYVAALRTPAAGGPPLAAARFPNFSFPMSFSLSSANMPMGGEWPEEFWLRVRIDADGDPMTPSDSDWMTDILGPFKKGDSTIEVLLSPQ